MKDFQLSAEKLAGLKATHGETIIDAVFAVFKAVEEEKAEKEKHNKDIDDILDKTSAQ